MTAYGGNLTVFHRFLFSGASVEDSEVILKGGGLELHYGLGAGPFMSGREQKSKFTLKVCTRLSLFKPASKSNNNLCPRKRVGLSSTQALQSQPPRRSLCLPSPTLR